jgi:hypothetical protein
MAAEAAAPLKINDRRVNMAFVFKANISIIELNKVVLFKNIKLPIPPINLIAIFASLRIYLHKIRYAATFCKALRL